MLKEVVVEKCCIGNVEVRASMIYTVCRTDNNQVKIVAWNWNIGAAVLGLKP